MSIKIKWDLLNKTIQIQSQNWKINGKTTSKSTVVWKITKEITAFIKIKQFALLGITQSKSVVFGDIKYYSLKYEKQIKIQGYICVENRMVLESVININQKKLNSIENITSENFDFIIQKYIPPDFIFVHGPISKNICCICLFDVCNVVTNCEH